MTIPESCPCSLHTDPWTLITEAAAAAERAAVNTVPQGSAADVCKLAMIDIHRRAGRELPRDSCRLLIQVRQMPRRHVVGAAVLHRPGSNMSSAQAYPSAGLVFARAQLAQG